MFARITKVNEERRTVTGVAAQGGIVDKQSEVFDYASSKPLFEAWSAETYRLSGGKSYGNIRSMHGNIAAGKLTAPLMFDDHSESILVEAKIVDDVEWAKVLEGVMTGFSIGGRYVKRWTDVVDGQMVQRYTAAPTEISLVDKPCIPTALFDGVYRAATFDVVKRDGRIVRKAFKNSEVEYMFTPRDENYCGRSTAANLIKAAMSAPAGDLTEAFGKSMRRHDQHLQQGISESLRKQLASAGMAVRGPTTSARNGATASTVDAIKAIHSGGARKMSPVSLPPQSDNSATAPTRIHPHITAPQGDQYRTPTYEAPPLFGAAPHDASESAPALPPGDSDQYDKTTAAIRGIHRQGPQRGYLR